MRKFMKNVRLNDYKGFQAAFSHTLEEIYCCTEHYYTAALSKTIKSQWCSLQKEYNIGRRVLRKGIIKILTLLEMPLFLFISCI